jgi:hypothetical protein
MLAGQYLDLLFDIPLEEICVPFKHGVIACEWPVIAITYYLGIGSSEQNMLMVFLSSHTLRMKTIAHELI